MKKIVYAVPPMKDPKGYATVGNMRQFQWFKDPTFAYPMIPALAVTMLAHKNQVLWLDAIAEELSEVQFGQMIIDMQPDYIIFECPTPLISRYIEIINGIKDNFPDIKIILCGDHVTAMEVPECKADHIVKGGKWYYDVCEIINGEKWTEKLPHINRNMTRAWLYAYRNGNFKFQPGTYIMASHDCWYGKCRFCSWSEYHKECTTRDVYDVLDEVDSLIKAGFKEIFDDSGTFPTGDWLKTFCDEVIKRGYNDYVAFGCNMRFGALTDEDFILMAKAGFRMILWGLESVNQDTLDMLNKGVQVKNISNDIVLAKAAGLSSHLTVMFGFPWESYKDAKRTYDMVRWWLRKGYVSSAQATVCIPYPITPLWKTCKENSLLLSEDWDEYDMTQPIMKIPYTEKELFKLQKGIYNIAFHPEFIWNKLRSIRDIEDLRYFLRIGKKIYDRFGNFHIVEKAVKD